MIKFGKINSYVVFTLLIIISVSTLHGAGSNQTNDIDIEVLEEEVKIELYKENKLLYSIDYDEFIIETEVDGEEKTYEIPLDEVGWLVEINKREDESFPHTNIALDTELRDDKGDFIGNLHFDINIFTRDDTSEVTFSFTLSDIEHLDGGTLSIFKDISTNGDMLRGPEGEKEYYKFIYPEHTGYYSWSNELNFDGETSNLNSWDLNGRGLVIFGDFDGSVEEVSMKSLEIEKTSVGVTVPVPESYDHFPSFVIGLMLGAGVVIGVLAEKRRKFYQNRDPEKTVKLEDSYYYRGKE